MRPAWPLPDKGGHQIRAADGARLVRGSQTGPGRRSPLAPGRVCRHSASVRWDRGRFCYRPNASVRPTRPARSLSRSRCLAARDRVGDTGLVRPGPSPATRRLLLLSDTGRAGRRDRRWPDCSFHSRAITRSAAAGSASDRARAASGAPAAPLLSARSSSPIPYGSSSAAGDAGLARIGLRIIGAMQSSAARRKTAECVAKRWPQGRWTGDPDVAEAIVRRRTARRRK